MKLKSLAPWKESYDQTRQHIKKQRHYFPNKGRSSQGYGFSSGHVWMWELDYKESWALKNWCIWTMVLEKALESPLDFKDIQTVHPKANYFWVFIGGSDVEAKTPIFWPPHVQSCLKRPWCWKRLRAEGEGDGRGWDGWMASLTQWTWVWIDSGSWWWTGRPGMLQFMGSERVRHNWTIELNWTLLYCWDWQVVSHQFQVVPECPTPLLGRDLSLRLKSCSYFSPDWRCFKTLFWEQNSYFYQLPRDRAPEWERPFMDVWSKNPQKSRPDYIPLRGS